MRLEVLLRLPVCGHGSDADIVPEHEDFSFLRCGSRGGSFDSGEIIKIEVKVFYSGWSCDRLAMLILAPFAYRILMS